MRRRADGSAARIRDVPTSIVAGPPPPLVGGAVGISANWQNDQGQEYQTPRDTTVNTTHCIHHKETWRAYYGIAIYFSVKYYSKLLSLFSQQRVQIHAARVRNQRGKDALTIADGRGGGGWGFPLTDM